MVTTGAAEMAQPIKGLAVLEEIPNLILSVHMSKHPSL